MKKTSTSTPQSSAPKRKIIKLVLAGLAVLLVAAGAVLYWAYKNRVDIQHWWRGEIVIDRNKYPIVGIDVSAHNGDIDFNKVRADGYTFVFIKASEGEDYQDSKFLKNYEKARRAGLKVGAYHFFRKKTDGLNQAKNFLEMVGWCKLDLPLVVDVEDWSNDDQIKDERTQKHLDAMLDNLKSRGYKVMIYTNGNGYKKYIKNGQININLWLCSFKQPDKLRRIPHQMQQYSHWGRVRGIWGDVDLNVFNGSEQQWLKWLEDLSPLQTDTTQVDSTLFNEQEEFFIDDEL
ncbi:MAG: hypothetical protein IJR20_09570 [Muribaculaceae bacterium]|nr:hypothetical protein [Muribaculaceae bacterium]